MEEYEIHDLKNKVSNQQFKATLRNGVILTNKLIPNRKIYFQFDMDTKLGAVNELKITTKHHLQQINLWDKCFSLIVLFGAVLSLIALLASSMSISSNITKCWTDFFGLIWCLWAAWEIFFSNGVGRTVFSEKDNCYYLRKNFTQSHKVFEFLQLDENFDENGRKEFFGQLWFMYLNKNKVFHHNYKEK